MDKKKILFIAMIFLPSVLMAGSPYFIFGKLFDADGSTGNATSANSYASVSIFREGIKNEIGEQNNGPETGNAKKIYPALYNGINLTAYTYTDVGSSSWNSAAEANQRVVAVFESVSGKNGYYGETMIGVSSVVITADDVNQSETDLPDAGLGILNAPVLDGYSTGVLQIKWQPLHANRVISYTVWRKNVSSGDFEKIGTTALLTFSDSSVTDGQSYLYAVSANIQWGGGNGADEYFETARSSSSAELTASYPTPTFTSTETATNQPDATATFTFTPAFTYTATFTYTPTAQPTSTPTIDTAVQVRNENVIKHKIIVFNNPVKGNVIKLGIYSKEEGFAEAIIYNLNAEEVFRFRIKTVYGVNVIEQVIKNIPSGTYILAVNLNYGGKKEKTEKIKIAVSK